MAITQLNLGCFSKVVRSYKSPDFSAKLIATPTITFSALNSNEKQRTVLKNYLKGQIDFYLYWIRVKKETNYVLLLFNFSLVHWKFLCRLTASDVCLTAIFQLRDCRDADNGVFTKTETDGADWWDLCRNDLIFWY